MINLLLAETTDLFNRQGILTLAGASTMTLVASNIIQYVFNKKLKIIPLFIAMLIAIAGVSMQPSKDAIDYLIGILNGFLIYSSALGVNEAASPSRNSSNENGERILGSGKSSKSARRGFFSSWLN